MHCCTLAHLSHSRGGGPMRRVAHPTREQAPGTSECYRCNKYGCTSFPSNQYHDPPCSQLIASPPRFGHFARECPEYTGTPYPNAYRQEHHILLTFPLSLPASQHPFMPSFLLPSFCRHDSPSSSLHVCLPSNMPPYLPPLLQSYPAVKTVRR